MSLRDLAKYAGGLLLAGVLMWWVLRGTDARSLWDQLRQVSVFGLILAATLNVGHNVFRVWRWRALLQPVQADVPFRPMFAAVLLGYMTSWVIPGRLGELVRPLVLSGQEGVPLGPCIGSVVADRLLDAAAVVILFAIGTWVTPLEGGAAEYEGLIRSSALAMTVAVVVGLALMAIVSARGAAISERLSDRRGAVAWIVRTIISVSRGAQSLRSPKLLARVALHSMLAWITIAAATWFGVRAAGADVSFGGVLVILPMLVLGVAIPTPGGAGSYHGLMKVGLMEILGVPEVAAVSAGLIMHALITVPIIVLGVILLWTEGISWKKLIAAAVQVRTLGDHADPAPAERLS